MTKFRQVYSNGTASPRYALFMASEQTRKVCAGRHTAEMIQMIS